MWCRVGRYRLLAVEGEELEEREDFGFQREQSKDVAVRPLCRHLLRALPNSTTVIENNTISIVNNTTLIVNNSFPIKFRVVRDQNCTA